VFGWKVFKKCKYDQKKLVWEKSKKVSETQNFTLISTLLKNFLQNAQKSYKQNKFDEHE